MIIKPFYSLIDHREFKYLKEKIKKEKGTWTIGGLSCTTDYFYNLDAIRITNDSNKKDDSNKESELVCYLTEWGVGYIIGEKKDITEKFIEKFLRTIVKGIKNPDEDLYDGFKKWLDEKDEDTKLETSLHGISFPLLRMDDINGEYEINFDEYHQTLREIKYSYKTTNNKEEKWVASITDNDISINNSINNNHKDILKGLCIQHHLYTTLKTVILHHSENTERNWTDIKRYVDVRTAQYRNSISILRGMLNEFSLFNKLFTKVWNMDVIDKPQIKEFTQKGDDCLKLTKNFDKEKVHKEIYQHTNIVSDVHVEINNFVTENVDLKLTDDVRSSQLSLKILQPLFVIGVVLSFMIIVFRIMGIDIFGMIAPKIFVVGAPIMVMKIIIFTLSMVVSMFWITLNIITYVRAFEQTIGASRSRSDIPRDIFFYIESMGMILIAIGLLIAGLESSQLIDTLAIVMIGVIIMLFFVFLIFTTREDSAGDGIKDNRKNILLEWTSIGASMFLSFLSVGFICSVEAVGALSWAYISLLWFILSMGWLFFLTYAQKMGNFIFVVNETKPWNEFKDRIRKKFADKINKYINKRDNEDPYEEWDYGRIFIKFKDDFLKKYIQRDVSLMLVYAVILMQTLAVTFNIGFIMDKNNLSLLFISAVASLLTTFIKLDEHIKAKVEERDGGRIYFLTAFIASIIADIHFMPAIIFYSADFSLPLAVGAFIANMVALFAILIEGLTIRNEAKEIEFEI